MTVPKVLPRSEVMKINPYIGLSRSDTDALVSQEINRLANMCGWITDEEGRHPLEGSYMTLRTLHSALQYEEQASKGGRHVER